VLGLRDAQGARKLEESPDGTRLPGVVVGRGDEILGSSVDGGRATTLVDRTVLATGTASNSTT